MLDFGRIIATGDPATDPGRRRGAGRLPRRRRPTTPAAAHRRGQRRAGGRRAHRARARAAGRGRHPGARGPRPAAPATATSTCIDGVSFEVAAGEVFALLGPNGAGKTTTLQVIAGLLPASSGTVAVCGRGILGADADALARAGVCLCPRAAASSRTSRVAENLRMATYTGTRRARRRGAGLRPLPPPGRAAQPDRRHHVGRRAADAGHGPGPGHRPGAAASSTSCRWAWRPIIVHELYDQVAEIAATGHLDPGGRAVRPRGARRGRHGRDHAARPHRQGGRTRRDRRRARDRLPLRRHGAA